jgi:hypothetical protein
MMAEGVTAISTKAIDELSGKVFIPGFIAALLVECSGYYLQYRPEASFIEIYAVFAFIGFIGAYLILTLLMVCIIYLGFPDSLPSKIGLVIMPLGLLGVFPGYFPMLDIPYSAVTGVAIIAWSFFLINTDVIEYLIPQLKS